MMANKQPRKKEGKNDALSVPWRHLCLGHRCHHHNLTAHHQQTADELDTLNNIKLNNKNSLEEDCFAAAAVMYVAGGCQILSCKALTD